MKATHCPRCKAWISVVHGCSCKTAKRIDGTAYDYSVPDLTNYESSSYSSSDNDGGSSAGVDF